MRKVTGQTHGLYMTLHAGLTNLGLPQSFVDKSWDKAIKDKRLKIRDGSLRTFVCNYIDVVKEEINK